MLEEEGCSIRLSLMPFAQKCTASLRASKRKGELIPRPGGRSRIPVGSFKGLVPFSVRIRTSIGLFDQFGNRHIKLPFYLLAIGPHITLWSHFNSFIASCCMNACFRMYACSRPATRNRRGNKFSAQYRYNVYDLLPSAY